MWVSTAKEISPIRAEKSRNILGIASSRSLKSILNETEAHFSSPASSLIGCHMMAEKCTLTEKHIPNMLYDSYFNNYREDAEECTSC